MGLAPEFAEDHSEIKMRRPQAKSPPLIGWPPVPLLYSKPALLSPVRIVRGHFMVCSTKQWYWLKEKNAAARI